MAWIASFWSSIGFWEIIEYAAEAIVIIGALGEFLTEFEFVLKGDEKRTIRHRIGKAAALMLIIGLAIELGALVRTNQLFSNTIGALYMEASDANERAAAASHEEFDLRIAMQPRRAFFLSRLMLPIEKQFELIGLIRSFAGTPLLIQTLGDNETNNLANDLQTVFNGNGWKARLVTEKETGRSPILMSPGVDVFTWKPASTPPSPDDRSPQARGWKAGEFVATWIQKSGPYMAAHWSISAMEKNTPLKFGPPQESVVVFIGQHNIDWDFAILQDKRKENAQQHKSSATPK
jgi:hypothetical protein